MDGLIWIIRLLIIARFLNFRKFLSVELQRMLETGIMRKVFSEAIGAPKVPSISWKDVGGLEHLKKEILRSLKSNMFSSGLKRSGKDLRWCNQKNFNFFYC
jgi:hypothetical protein